jgi:hypothetical protein
MTDENTAIEQIVTRAWEDEAFKQEILNNPKPAIEQTTGEKLPEDLVIRVVQETPNVRYIMLPSVSSMTPEERQQTVNEFRQEATGDFSSVIVRAIEDDTFKQELVSQPNAVIERELGITLPEGSEIRVLEQEDNIRYLVLPMQPDSLEGDELSEAELEAVAGGIKWLPDLKCGKTVSSLICSINNCGVRC